MRVCPEAATGPTLGALLLLFSLQAHAKKVLAVAVHNHYKRVEHEMEAQHRAAAAAQVAETALAGRTMQCCVAWTLQGWLAYACAQVAVQCGVPRHLGGAVQNVVKQHSSLAAALLQMAAAAAEAEAAGAARLPPQMVAGFPPEMYHQVGLPEQLRCAVLCCAVPWHQGLAAVRSALQLGPARQHGCALCVAVEHVFIPAPNLVCGCRTCVHSRAKPCVCS